MARWPPLESVSSGPSALAVGTLQGKKKIHVHDERDGHVHEGELWEVTKILERLEAGHDLQEAGSHLPKRVSVITSRSMPTAKAEGGNDGS